MTEPLPEPLSESGPSSGKSQSSPSQLKRLLGQTMLDRRFHFRRRLDQLEKSFVRIADDRAKSPLFENAEMETRRLAYDRELAALTKEMTDSAELARRRRKSVPKMTFDEELPVSARRNEIANTIRENQVVVLCGETGSGKSTQLPKICLELGRGVFGLIGHTQPRRIAARSIAGRIAEELGPSGPALVGYKIRFTDETGPNTLVKVMTDGILLAESQTDPFFDRYDTIIIDEAHERSLNIDFLLGMLKRVLAKRPNLKLIITSATIDAERFARHFSSAKGPAPVCEVTGRGWPVDILYRPVDERDDEDESARPSSDDDQQERALLDAVDEVARMERGDILVFMPTERDIFETAKLLKRHSIPGDDAARKTEILPLYARLPSAQQQKIFHPGSWRRIVIATNVAESSLTVPGIRYVIDPGTARISRYSARSRTQRLPIEPVSRASADQRAGRCGRTGPGVCIRLYSREDYEAREKYTTPEIRRTNLAAVILRTKALRLGDVERFPFIDPPGSAAVNEGYKTLFELGAIDERNELSDIGRVLSRLPVDPRIARMILAGSDEKCIREVLVIAAMLEIQDPRERPLDAQQKADEAHAQFADENSDFLSCLKMWDFWQKLKDSVSRSQLQKACRQNFLSFNRMREWADIHLQLVQLVREAKLPMTPRQESSPELYNAIHRAVLVGLLYGVAKKSDSVEYLTTGNAKFFLWPGSGLFKKKYAWILAAERVETTKKYLRTVAKIDPEWIEPLAKHLLVSTVFEPFWCRETGYVHAYEKVTLYGLTIVPKRRVNYGPTHSKEARTIFIENALVQRDYDCTLDFYARNEETVERLRRLEAKLRRHQLLVGDDVLFRFYDSRLPDDVYDNASLTKWYRALGPDAKRRMLLTPADLGADGISEETFRSFPDTIETFQGSLFELDYAFDPGGPDDGVSIVAPVGSLAQLDARQAGWLVPGLFEQKITAVLKTLPKTLRRELVPIPDTARAMAATIPFGVGDLVDAVAREASRLAGRLITRDDFDLARIPPELALNIKVVDDGGNVVAQGRDLAVIQKELGVQARQAVAATSDPKWNRDDLDSWDIGSFPESITITRGGMSIKAFPAFVDPRFLAQEFEPGHAIKGVSLRLFDSPGRAVLETRRGLAFLFNLLVRSELGKQAKWIPDIQKHCVWLQSLHGLDVVGMCRELIGAIAVQSEDCAIPRNEGEFNRLVQSGKARIGLATQEVTGWIARFAPGYQAARVAIERNRTGTFKSVADDARAQLDDLFEPFFYLETPWLRLREFPRYLQAIAARFEKVKTGGIRNDTATAAEIDEYRTRWLELKAQHEAAGIVDPELETFRWMIEEYRVSLFAQKLGTAIKVSPTRLEKQYDKISR